MIWRDAWLTRSGSSGRGLIASVLVVDDEAVVRRVTYRYLNDAGYRVLEAEDAEEAMYVMERGRPDLIVLDVVMPEVNGVALASHIHARWPAQRILFMSAHNDQVLLESGMELGRDAVLDKPFTRDELLTAVESILAAQRAKASEKSEGE
ncbi:MAG TPA: response regulator [Gemmatimonadales bacterium]|nr:response regulator [Gemmatimonadales bacterium]